MVFFQNEGILLLANTHGEMKMIISEEIREAIRQAISIVGNPYQLSLRLEGIRHTTIRDWISGKTKSISDENWEKVREIVGNILNEEGISVPWGRGYDLSSAANSWESNANVIDLLDKIEHLSAIERNRLFICMSSIEDFKKNHPADEIEFSFSAEVTQSTNQKLIGRTCNDDDTPMNITRPLIPQHQDHN